MSKNVTRRTVTARATAVALSAAAFALIAPAAAIAQPTIADSGSAIIDSGSSILNGGNVVDNGSSIANSGSAIIGGIFGIDTGSSGAKTQQCNASTQSGGAGVTDTIHQLGRTGPNSFTLSYETYGVPDLIEVFYQGGLIHSTGYIGDDTNEGTGSTVVNVPAGPASSVVVRVTGPGGTDWDYTVNCPF